MRPGPGQKAAQTKSSDHMPRQARPGMGAEPLPPSSNVRRAAPAAVADASMPKKAARTRQRKPDTAATRWPTKTRSGGQWHARTRVQALPRHWRSRGDEGTAEVAWSACPARSGTNAGTGRKEGPRANRHAGT
jgi:hypothetical protein